MLASIKQMLGMAPKADLAEIISRGAVIVDVRSKAEYAGGHLNNSINIPLNELPSNINKLKKDKPVITCCASGMRSSSAKSTLESAGFKEVHNGGSWVNLKKFDK